MQAACKIQENDYDAEQVVHVFGQVGLPVRTANLGF